MSLNAMLSKLGITYEGKTYKYLSQADVNDAEREAAFKMQLRANETKNTIQPNRRVEFVRIAQQFLDNRERLKQSSDTVLKNTLTHTANLLVTDGLVTIPQAQIDQAAVKMLNDAAEAQRAAEAKRAADAQNQTNSTPPKKSNTGLYIGIGLGVAALATIAVLIAKNA